MKRNSVLSFFLLLVLPLATIAQPDRDIEAVKAILMRQSADWNRGDIDAFMEGYWPSEKLQFIGSSGVTYGWQNTLDRYKQRYPGREAMGQLTFDILEVQKLSRKVIMLTGRYRLKRESDEPSGYFLLIWRKINRRWVIVADHTS